MTNSPSDENPLDPEFDEAVELILLEDQLHHPRSTLWSSEAGDPLLDIKRARNYIKLDYDNYLKGKE
jgi:hypothetical protein